MVPDEATELLAPGSLIYVVKANYLDEIKAMTGYHSSYESMSQ
jgi:hypothetical protein